jgi:UDP-hydrolysing UDP-N-acetyl-D-glucosamine 2-epimerase
MKMKRKICVVITARPSYSRIRSALLAIQSRDDLELQIIVGASGIIDRYGDISKIIAMDGFRVDAKIMNLLEGENPEAMAKTTGLGIIELSSVFASLGPHAVLTIADRYETLGTAVASAFMCIPLIHVQGGEVTGNIDDKVRHAITKLADIHFVSNENARHRVIKLGEEEGTVFNTGCPSIDLAKRVLEMPPLSLKGVSALRSGVGVGFDFDSDYIVVLQHPVTSEFDMASDQIGETLAAVDECGIQAIWLWPNPDAGSDGTSKGIRLFRERNPANRINFFKNFEPELFLHILKGAKCVVGNSSVAIRECAFLGVPAVNIGSRQEDRQRGQNVLDVDYDKFKILSGIREQVKKFGVLRSDNLYGDGYSGKRIADLCAAVDLRASKRLTY